MGVPVTRQSQLHMCGYCNGMHAYVLMCSFLLYFVCWMCLDSGLSCSIALRARGLRAMHECGFLVKSMSSRFVCVGAFCIAVVSFSLRVVLECTIDILCLAVGLDLISKCSSCWLAALRCAQDAHDAFSTSSSLHIVVPV